MIYDGNAFFFYYSLVLNAIQFQREECLISEKEFSKVKANKSLFFFFFFLLTQSFTVLVYNCDESFFAWWMETPHSTKFHKSAIYVRDTNDESQKTDPLRPKLDLEKKKRKTFRTLEPQKVL